MNFIYSFVGLAMCLMSYTNSELVYGRGFVDKDGRQIVEIFDQQFDASKQKEVEVNFVKKCYKCLIEPAVSGEQPLFECEGPSLVRVDEKDIYLDPCQE
uniref:X1.D.A5.1 n=1 Tax=Schmidtea mediterranea TaxID=79327 RepID=V9XTG6_SCHMD|nr:X1.D.A5.1 [Schmidtea mediterranea]